MKIDTYSPNNGRILDSFETSSKTEVEIVCAQAQRSFSIWKNVPAPVRGEFIRKFGNTLREEKECLALYITKEVGKPYSESLGEVQEAIDICDYAVGLSRQLYGKTIPSERPYHTMQELWRPLGPTLVISAFNFPVAVWAWNFAIAIVCGNPVVWKPSEKALLTACEVQRLYRKTDGKFRGFKIHHPLSYLVLGDGTVGRWLTEDPTFPLVSATGSTQMGRLVGTSVQQRFGRLILELGGNNAAIVTHSADLDNAATNIAFGIIGTTGQRCTSTRRVIIHESVYDQFLGLLQDKLTSLHGKIGNPEIDSSVIAGPLIDKQAYANMLDRISLCSRQGCTIYGGRRILQKDTENGYYVTPCIVELPLGKYGNYAFLKDELFAPLAYVMRYRNIEEAVQISNDVPQGLSSAIFTNDIKEAEYFKLNSYCGIANVNIGTSGAEIGGAFGGEKETGGGRESGSDAWKQYMRRVTSTTFYGEGKPKLAQGVEFS